MKEGDSIAFDDDSRPVLTVQFDYPNDEPEPKRKPPRVDVITFTNSILLNIGNAPGRALKSRIAAMLVLLGHYPRCSIAAAAFHIHRCSVGRALRVLRTELQHVETLRRAIETDDS